MHLRTLQYEFYWNMLCALSTHVAFGRRMRGKSKTCLPFDTKFNENLLGMNASSGATSLKKLLNYLLTNGQVKCQQQHSRKKIKKLVRRKLREEDYSERLLSKAI